MTTSSTTDATATPPAPATSRPGADGRLTLGRVVSAELIKLRSVRSMMSAMVITVVSIVGMGLFGAVGLIVAKPPPDGEAATADPTGAALTGVTLAVYVVAAFGVLAVTSEYATGTIKPTLAAVPRRGLLVAGKTTAVAGVTFVVTLMATLGAFLAAKVVLSTAGITISLGAPGVLRAVTGAALYLAVVAILSSALGWLLRSIAGAFLATLVGILVVPQLVALLVPPRLAEIIGPYLPGSAATAIMQSGTRCAAGPMDEPGRVPRLRRRGPGRRRPGRSAPRRLTGTRSSPPRLHRRTARAWCADGYLREGRSGRPTGVRDAPDADGDGTRGGHRHCR